MKNPPPYRKKKTTQKKLKKKKELNKVPRSAGDFLACQKHTSPSLFPVDHPKASIKKCRAWGCQQAANQTAWPKVRDESQLRAVNHALLPLHPTTLFLTLANTEQPSLQETSLGQ